jgi:hypothetical protein
LLLPELLVTSIHHAGIRCCGATLVHTAPKALGLEMTRSVTLIYSHTLMGKLCCFLIAGDQHSAMQVFAVAAQHAVRTAPDHYVTAMITRACDL